jgi:hypothetical protein
MNLHNATFGAPGQQALDKVRRMANARLMRDDTALRDLVADTIGRPVHAGVRKLAQELWPRYPDAAALIAYGSCLRGEDPKDTLVDFYLLTHDLAEVSSNFFARIGCRLLPPNVHYLEAPPYRAKYAVMTVAQFARRMRRDVANPYFWARFSQPVALLHGDKELVAGALTAALTTMYAHGLGLGGEGVEAFTKGFAETYRTELRSERAGRAEAIVAANEAFYRQAVRHMPNVSPINANWRRRRMLGKMLSVLRLIKAAFTFAGGADYLAWKIARHSGEAIALKPWQRRHPVIAGLLLLPRLLRSGAVR